MDENQELAVAQMRRAVHKLGSSTEGYGDITLIRFLVARSFDIDKAANMFVQWQNWRTSFLPLNYIPQSEITNDLQHNKIFLQGLSAKGNPLVIVKVHRHIPNKDQLQFKKFVVHLLDKTIASGFRGKEIGNEKLVSILDLQKLAYKNIDVRGMITGFQFLQIVIVSNEEERRALIRDIGLDALPEEYGGHAKLTLLQDFELKPLEERNSNSP